jgi:hypothetical protein
MHQWQVGRVREGYSGDFWWWNGFRVVLRFNGQRCNRLETGVRGLDCVALHW